MIIDKENSWRLRIVESEKNVSWVKAAGARTIVVVGLIGVLTPFWVYLVFFTNLPELALAGIALLMLLILSTATAWAAVAVPHRMPNASEAPASEPTEEPNSVDA